jgi:hypothetical protein
VPRDGEPAKLTETEVGGHPRRARGHAVIREQGPARLFQAQSEQVALWRRPMYRPERHASVPIPRFASVCGLQPVSDSEVRLNLRHAPARTSESKDTGKAMILAPPRTRSSQSDLRHGCANFGFAALVADFGIVGHQQLYDSSAALNPKFATGLAAVLVRTSGSRH